MKRVWGVILLLAFVVTAGATELSWSTNLHQAVKQAAAEKKKIFLLFTGSDWCRYCIQLENNILATDEFKKFAATELVLVKIDFPEKKHILPIQLQENEKLKKKFGVEGFPTIFILDTQEKTLGQVDNEADAPADFIAAIRHVIANPGQAQLPAVDLPKILGKNSSARAIALYHAIQLPPADKFHTHQEYCQQAIAWMKTILIDRPLADKTITPAAAAWLAEFLKWYFQTDDSQNPNQLVAEGIRLYHQGNTALPFVLPLFRIYDGNNRQLARELQTAIRQAWATHADTSNLLRLLLDNRLHQNRNQIIIRMLQTGDLNQAPPRYVYQLLVSFADKWNSAEFQNILKFLQNSKLDPWIALMFEARGLWNYAYELRGSGWADTVTEKGWAGFQEYGEKSYQLYRQAYQLHPEWPEAAAELVQVCNPIKSKQETVQWFNRAIAAEIDDSTAFWNFLWAFRPRWGGSWDEMLAIGRRMADADDHFYNTRLPLVYWWALQNVAEELSNHSNLKTTRAFLDEQWPALEKIIRRQLELAVRSHKYLLANHLHAIFGRYLWACGKYQPARAELSTMSWLDNGVDYVCTTPSFWILPLGEVIQEVVLATSTYQKQYQELDALTAAGQYAEAGKRWIQLWQQTSAPAEKRLFSRKAVWNLADNNSMPLNMDEGIFLLARLGCIEGVKAFLDAGCSVNARGLENCTLIQRSLAPDFKLDRQGDLAIPPKIMMLQFLLSRGADIKMRGGPQWTTLHLAVYHKVPLMVLAFVLDKQPEAVNAGDVDNETPLIWCAMLNLPEQADFLLKHGADVNIRTQSGETALDRAPSQDFANLLIAAGGKSGRDLPKK